MDESGKGKSNNANNNAKVRVWGIEVLEGRATLQNIRPAFTKVFFLHEWYEITKSAVLILPGHIPQFFG